MSFPAAEEYRKTGLKWLNAEKSVARRENGFCAILKAWFLNFRYKKGSFTPRGKETLADIHDLFIISSTK